MSDRSKLELWTLIWLEAGFLSSAFLIGRIGLLDTVHALSFFGVLTGVLMAIAAVLMLAGAVSSFGYFNGKHHKDGTSRRASPATQGAGTQGTTGHGTTSQDTATHGNPTHGIAVGSTEEPSPSDGGSSQESHAQEPPGASIPAACILLGILATLIANAMMLIVQLMGFELRGLLFAWAALTLWALLTLVFIPWHYKVWQDISAGYTLKAGLAAAGVIAIANFAYTQIYVPSASATAEAAVATVTFGTAQPRPGGGTLVPMHISLKNTGSSGLWIVTGLYEVDGETIKQDANISSGPNFEELYRSAVNGTEYHADYTIDRNDLLESGPTVDNTAGSEWLNPGESLDADKVIEVPKASPYEFLTAQAYFTIARKDRVTIQQERAGTAYSWVDHINLPHWATPGDGEQPDFIRYQYNIEPGTEILRETRSRENLYVWFVIYSKGPYQVLSVAKPGAQDAEPTDKDWNSWISRYGLQEAPSGTVELALSGLPGQ